MARRAGLAIALGTLMAGFASAEGTAEATPAVAAPGTVVQLVYTLPNEGLVRMGAQERLACRIEGPEGFTPIDCSSGTQALEVKVLPAARSYVVPFGAPAIEGAYMATFARQGTLSAPPDASAASVEFEVRAPAPLVSADAEPAVGEVAAILPEDDAGRWLASATMGGGALTAAIVVGRRGRGGIR